MPFKPWVNLNRSSAFLGVLSVLRLCLFRPGAVIHDDVPEDTPVAGVVPTRAHSLFTTTTIKAPPLLVCFKSPFTNQMKSRVFSPSVKALS